MVSIEKPSSLEMRLAEINVATGLKVEYRQTGTDTAETFWIVTDWNDKKHEFVGGIPRSYITIDPDYRSVFTVKKQVLEKVDAWKKFERSNAHELAEYKRLKEKFGG